MLRGAGENAAHAGAAVLQPADEIERLIGGNAAADDEQDPHAGRRRAPGLTRSPRRRLEILQRLAAGILCRRPQDDADLVLHRAAVACRAQAQLLLQFVIELPDGEAGHGRS